MIYNGHMDNRGNQVSPNEQEAVVVSFIDKD